MQSIADNAFKNRTDLTKVTLPDTLETIGASAFYGCTSLTGVVLNSGLSALNNYTFQNCTALTEIIIPSSVTILGSYAFSGCTSLTKVTLNEGLTTINSYIFQNCTALERVTFPASVTTLAGRAFYNCTSLSHITYPVGWTTTLDYRYNSTTTVSDGDSYYTSPFAGCTSLSTVTVPEGVTAIPKHAFQGYTGLKTVVLPDSLTTISSYAFHGATGLTDITLPVNLAAISSYAFYGCVGLRLLQLDESLRSIGSYAFYGCDGILSLLLNDGLETIADYAFASCANLSAVTVPQSVTSIASTAFSGCPKLTIYCYSGSAMHLAAEENGLTFYLLDQHDHQYVTSIETEATCTRGGSQILTCSICGYAYTELLNPLGHTYGEWMITKAATVLQTGTETRICQVCGDTEETVVEKLAIPEGQEDSYGIAHFHVVDAESLTPLKNISICLQTEEEEVTLVTDSDGRTSHILPVGKVTAVLTGNGIKPRTIQLTVQAGEQTFPDIGVSKRPLVDATITHHVMTMDEMIEAGIDVNDSDNYHVYKYEAKLVFEPVIDVFSFFYYFDSNGSLLGIGGGGGSSGSSSGSGSGTIILGGTQGSQSSGSGGGGGICYNLSGGGTVTVYPVSEKFLLLIYGEVHWMKEMFDVEMLITNHSNTDTIENCVAQINLPEGLSLAPMVGDAQSFSREVGTIEEGGTRSIHWYVRGDQEGSYNLTASLTGTMQPFGEDFSHTYVVDHPLKVYAGSAMKLTFEVPRTTYRGDHYPIKITLTNVSDRTLYNVRHEITNLIQSKVTYYSDGSAEETKYLETGYLGNIGVEEFKPGDKIVIELTTEILFESAVFQYQAERFASTISGIASIMKAAEMITNAGEAAEDLGSFLSDASGAVTKGWISEEGFKSVHSLLDLTDYMEFGSGNAVKPGDNFDLYESLMLLMSCIPVQFYLTDAVVTTLEGSTTEIPYEFVFVKNSSAAPQIPAIGSVSKYLYSCVIAAFGKQDAKLGFLTLKDDITGYDDAISYLKAVQDTIKAFKATDPTGATTFRAWVEPSGASARLSSTEEAFSLTADASDAVYEDGVLTFTGDANIEVTPHTLEGGTLCIQAGDQPVQKFVLDIVEPHTCGSNDWVVEVPPTDKTTGYRAKYCDICGEMLAFEEMTPCGNHQFGEFSLDLAPTEESMGIETRTCTQCGALEYRLVEYAQEIIRDTKQMADSADAAAVAFPLLKEVNSENLRLLTLDGKEATSVTLSVSSATLCLQFASPITQEEHLILEFTDPAEQVQTYELIIVPYLTSVTDLLTDELGTLSADKNHFILKEDITPEVFYQKVAAPSVVVRTSRENNALSVSDCFATGQKLSLEGQDETISLIVPGDCNGDGLISWQDAEIAMSGILSGSITEEQTLATDINMDGMVSVQELAQLAISESGLGEAAPYRVVLSTYRAAGQMTSVNVFSDTPASLESLLSAQNWDSVKLYVLSDTIRYRQELCAN